MNNKSINDRLSKITRNKTSDNFLTLDLNEEAPRRIRGRRAGSDAGVGSGSRFTGKIKPGTPDFADEREASRREIESQLKDTSKPYDHVPAPAARRAERVGLRPGRRADSENLVAVPMDNVGAVGQTARTRTPAGGMTTAFGKKVKGPREGVPIASRDAIIDQKASEAEGLISGDTREQVVNSINPQPMQVGEDTPSLASLRGFNWAELATAAALHDPSVRSRDDINRVASELENVPDFEKYQQNLNHPDRFNNAEGRNGGWDRRINAFLDSFHSQNDFNPDPENIWMSSRAEGSPSELRDRLDGLSTRENKADLMLKLADGDYRGLSIKADTQAPYDSPNLLPILREIAENSGNEELVDAITALGEAKPILFGEAGLPQSKTEYDRERRNAQPGDRFYRHRTGTTIPQEYSNILKDLTNPFNQGIENLFEQFPEEMRQPFIEDWVKNNYPDDNFPYEMFRFDSDKLERVHRDDIKGDVQLKRTGPFGPRGGNSMSDNWAWLDGDGSRLAKVNTLTPLSMLWNDTRFSSRPFKSTDQIREFGQ